jgi:hypothetical protein
MKKHLDKIFMTITIIGVICVSLSLVLSEVLYPTTDSLSKEPLWYLLFFSLSWLVAGVGAVGGVVTKNRGNTTKWELIIEGILMLVGVILMCFTLSPTETRWKDILSCTGGAVFIAGFICAMPSLAGLIKRASYKMAGPPHSREWCLMMDLYQKDKISSPLYELIEYQDGVYGEGHYCNFDNKAERLDEITQNLKNILPEELWKNYETALNSYKTGNHTEEVCSKADGYLYEHGSVIDEIINSCSTHFTDYVKGYKDCRDKLESFVSEYDTLLNEYDTHLNEYNINLNEEAPNRVKIISKFCEIYNFVLDLEEKDFIVIVKKDCELSHLRDIMQNYGPERFAAVEFSLLSHLDESYKIAVSVRSLPTFKAVIK